jgi:hypothetical protein
LGIEAVPYPEILARLPEDSTLILRHVNWDEYESLIDALGEGDRKD